jgi:O-antigen ligase
MSAEAQAAEAPDAPWELTLLLVVAACAVLPDLYDVDAFKTATVALLAGVLLLPRMLLSGTDELRAWFGSAGGRLHLLAAALAVPAAAHALAHAGTIDRLLGTVLAATAAMLGLRAAAAGLSFTRALQGATLLVAVAALLQSVGLLGALTAPGSDGQPEIVATLANTTRAGALLALGVCSAFAQLVAPDGRESHGRERLAAATLNLGVAALLLTRARGAWLAAAAGLVVLAWISRAALGARWRAWLVPLVVGVALGGFLGDGKRLLAPQVEIGGPLLSTGDVTTEVRFSIWRGTLRLVQEHPLLGIGLGRFREAFPPYREPGEARLPGREGLPTEVDHPHDELLLAFAEGGVPAGLCLLGFLLLTLRRAAARATGAAGAFGEPPADGGLSDRAAFGVLIAGTLTGLVQNSWTAPGTALPFFAAAGWVWRPALAPEPSAGGRRLARGLLVLLIAGTLVLAVPRMHTQALWYRFFRDADSKGVNLQNFGWLTQAADASPGDIDVQTRLVHFADAIGNAVPDVAQMVRPAKDRALLRIGELRAAP